MRARAQGPLFSALILAASAGAPRARASEPAPSAADVDSARSLMRAAMAERGKGNHERALAHFEAAHKIMHVPSTGAEVCQSQVDLGRLVEARETCLSVGRMPVGPREPEAFVRARKKAKELADDLAARIPTVRIAIASTAPGVVVSLTIDDEPMPLEALAVPRRLNPGAHVLVAQAGATSKRVEFVLVERDEKVVEIDLAPPAPVEPTKAIEPVTVTPPKSGDGARAAVEAPRTGASARAPLVVSGFGLAAVGVVLGTVSGIVSLHHAGTLGDTCDGGRCPPSMADDLSSARTWARVSNVSFAIAGVGAAVGVVGLLLPGPKVEPRTGVSASMWIGVGSIGVAGRF